MLFRSFCPPSSLVLRPSPTSAAHHSISSTTHSEPRYQLSPPISQVTASSRLRFCREPAGAHVRFLAFLQVSPQHLWQRACTFWYLGVPRLPDGTCRVTCVRSMGRWDPAACGCRRCQDGKEIWQKIPKAPVAYEWGCRDVVLYMSAPGPGHRVAAKR